MQACHFLGDGLNPDLEEGEGSGFGADGDEIDVALAEVGLVEHVALGRVSVVRWEGGGQGTVTGRGAGRGGSGC